ncbi:hypothetical protein BDV97DRAFT_367724 [Delphinella strobiligena]|nr:hypothetical protein BDV97DRAFT_367724 [Delphinella strobiligena]
MRHSLIILLVASLVNSLPLGLIAFSPKQLLSWQHTLEMQQPFQPTPDTNPTHTSGQDVDEGRPRSVEMLFTSEDDEEVVHIWLPLGKRMHTRDHPILPLHPQTALITRVLTHPNEDATNERILEQTACVIHPVEKSILGLARKWLKRDTATGFRRRDGAVKFEDADNPWFLAGKEVESYDCF